MYSNVYLYKQAELYKRAQLIKLCSYILYEKESRLYGPYVANILREKRAGAAGAATGMFAKAMPYLGGAMTIAFPLMSGYAGWKTGGKIGDWVSSRVFGWDPNSTGAKVVRGIGNLGGAALGAYLGYNFMPISRGIGALGKGLLGIKGNASTTANILFGGAGKTLGMGGAAGLLLGGVPEMAFGKVGDMAGNSAEGAKWDMTANRRLDQRYGAMGKNNFHNYSPSYSSTSSSYQNNSGNTYQTWKPST